MTTQDKGLRSLYPNVVLPDEEKEIQDAKDYIKRKVGDIDKLHAAPSLSSEDINILSTNLHKPIIEKLPEEKKDEYGYTPSQNREIEEYLTRPKDPHAKGTWDRFVKFNKEEDKRRDRIEEEKKLEKLKKFGIEESSTRAAGYPVVSKPPILKNNINSLPKNKKILPALKGSVQVDPKHPDGFRLTDDEDLYKHYADTPVRYIQEIMYKYENDAPVPTETVKRFDSMDKSSYPSDANQKKLLTKYQSIYNKLNPVQKKQLVAIQRKK